MRDMESWVGERWEWNIEWRRALFERESGTINDFFNVINRISLSQAVKDKWSWKASKDESYWTKMVYSKLAKMVVNLNAIQVDRAFKWVWTTATPFKVATTAWRIIWNTISTKENLQK